MVGQCPMPRMTRRLKIRQTLVVLMMGHGSLSTTYGSSKKKVQNEEENDDDECVFSLEL